jgi:hypothetical protein
MAERRLWDSINTIRDGFAVFDPAQRLVAANRAYLAAFDGLAVAPGLGYDSIVRWAAEQAIVDTGELSVDAWVDAMMARWDSDPIEPIVLKFSNNTWVRLVDRRARDGDMVTLAVDITEQMRIWAAIEAIPDGFVLFDKDDRLLTCNQRYRDIYPDSAPAMVPGSRISCALAWITASMPMRWAAKRPGWPGVWRSTGNPTACTSSSCGTGAGCASMTTAHRMAGASACALTFPGPRNSRPHWKRPGRRQRRRTAPSRPSLPT